MPIPIDEAKPGTRVWVLVYGYWRRALVARVMRRRVVLRWINNQGTVKECVERAINVQPENFDPADAKWGQVGSSCLEDRPIAKAGLWGPTQ